MRQRLVVAVVVLGAAATAHAVAPAGRRGLVVAGKAPAALAGAELLRAGGNAVDAAVGAAFVLAVCEQHSSGLGGGGFATVRVGGQVHFLDFREVAPKAARRDMFVRDGKVDPRLSLNGSLAAGVPGAVAGYLELLARYGKLPRARVLAPAIALAEKGFAVGPRFRAAVIERLEVLRADPEAAALLLVTPPGGGPPGPPPLGHRIVQRDLARVLRALASAGASEFYRGDTARRLAADMARRHGLVTLEDLAAYRVRERRPLVGTFRGLTVVTAPPPSSGGAIVLTLLNALETLPAGSRWHDLGALRLYLEISKSAFADRELLGDPGFVPDPTPALVDKARAARLMTRVGERARPARDVPAGEATPFERPTPLLPAPERQHTSNIGAIDAAGDAVALTSTLNYVWGAAIVARGTGIMWNDEMDDFATAPGVPNAYGIVGSEANAVAPGKVPLSTMSPTLVLDGPTEAAPVRMVVGGAGGPRIATAVTEIIVNHLLYGADVQQAVTLGRVRHQHLPDAVFVEPFGLDPATTADLRALGYEVRDETYGGIANAIAVVPPDGVRTGYADPRGDGAAVAE